MQGPGFYDPDPNKVLPRTDILGAKMAPLNENNDREKAMDLANKDAADPLLNIVYSQVERRPATVVIKGPVDRKDPPNMPDALLNPERWEFYDVNTAAVRPNTAVGGIFAKEDFLTFKLKEQEREMLREYLQMQHRVPDPGYYDPVFNLLESGVAIPDFGRYLERSRIMTKEEIMQRDIDGDVLVLDPQQPQGKGGVLVDYKKMPGRPEPKIENFKEHLDLSVDYKQIDARVKGNIDMVACVITPEQNERT